ncbi:MAG: response regulator transcription factor, partial [Chloroflexi bacterium]|nr:response regulator transcription factor [Chloroflexota bacterium]
MRNNKRPRRRPSTLRGGFFAAEPAKRAQQAGARGNSGRKAVHRRASREREVGKDPLEALTRPANLPTTEFGTAKRTTTIVLADDHNMVRQGLRTVLDIEPDLQVIGEAADGAEAVVQIERLKPEVLVLDLLMPRLSGLDVIRQAMERQPQLQIVVLTMVAFEVYVGRALKYGARGYVLKDSFSTDLVKAIREVSAGRTCIAPANFRQAVENFSLSVTNIVDPDATLTPRELEVLKLVAEGLTHI